MISFWQRSTGEHKRVTLTDPHMRDAAHGGSVNEGRMVKQEPHTVAQMMTRMTMIVLEVVMKYGQQQKIMNLCPGVPYIM